MLSTSHLITVLRTVLLLLMKSKVYRLGTFVVSFGVESLFTNIVVDECIDLAVKYIKEGRTPSSFPGPRVFK